MIGPARSSMSSALCSWLIFSTGRRSTACSCLVNNAGIGALGAFEATPMATAREIFETNTFGVMAMTQAVLPQLRERRSGVVVNVTSSSVLAPMPLVAVYAASKHAIEGFTESLALELEDFDVSVKLVEPGYGPATRFTTNGQARMDGLIPDAYARFAQRVMADFSQPTAVTAQSDVATLCGRPRTMHPASFDSPPVATRSRWLRRASPDALGSGGVTEGEQRE